MQADLCLSDSRQAAMHDDTLNRLELPFRCSETGSSECHIRFESRARDEPKSTKDRQECRDQSHDVLLMIEESDRQDLHDHMAALLAQKVDIDQSLEFCTRGKSTIETKKHEYKTPSGELFRQYVEERIQAIAFTNTLDVDRTLLDLPDNNFIRNEIPENKLSANEKADRVIEEIYDTLIDEALHENQEIQFRNQVCPEDDMLQGDSGEEYAYSDKLPIYAIRTNQHAIAEFLTILVDFIVENYAEVIVQKFNAGADMNASDMIRFLREKEILLYANNDDQKQLTGFSSDENDLYDTIENFDSPRLLDHVIFKALRAEVMVYNI